MPLGLTVWHLTSMQTWTEVGNYENIVIYHRPCLYVLGTYVSAGRILSDRVFYTSIKKYTSNSIVRFGMSYIYMFGRVLTF